MANWARALLVLALLLVARAAAAQRVLLERPAATDPLLFEAFGRLRAELQLQEFEVVVLEVAETPGVADTLERAAQEHGAFAAIALQRTGDGTTAGICIVDRVTGKTTTRRLRVAASRDAPTLLAVSAVDLLRASLLEITQGTPVSREVVGAENAPPPPEVVRFSQRFARFQVRAGGLALLTPVLGGSGGALLAASVRPAERLAFGVELGGPLFGAQFRVDDGAATVRQEVALVRGSYNVGSVARGRRWQWGPLLGVGAYHLEARGKVALPLVGQTGELWAFAADAGFCVEYFFNRNVSLGIDAAALTLYPRPVIAVADRRSEPLGVLARAGLSVGVAF